jgi:hypothetical protein
MVNASVASSADAAASSADRRNLDFNVIMNAPLRY